MALTARPNMERVISGSKPPLPILLLCIGPAQRRSSHDFFSQMVMTVIPARFWQKSFRKAQFFWKD